MNYSLALRWKAKNIVANVEDFQSMPDESTCLSFKTICNGAQTLGNEWLGVDLQNLSITEPWQRRMQLPPKTRGHNNNLDIIYLDTVLFFEIIPLHARA